MVPLTRLTRKNAPWDWNPSVMKPSAFSSFQLGTYVSPFSAGSGTDPRTIRSPEYSPFGQTTARFALLHSTYDKELLAIFKAFKTWHHYLESRTVLSTSRTSSISQLRRPSRVIKPIGWNAYRHSKWWCAFILGNSVRSPILSLVEWITISKRGIGNIRLQTHAPYLHSGEVHERLTSHAPQSSLSQRCRFGGHLRSPRMT